MKVVYRSIMKEIENIADHAATNRRTIDYIQLVPSEIAELRQELAQVDPGKMWACHDRDALLVHGVLIKAAK